MTNPIRSCSLLPALALSLATTGCLTTPNTQPTTSPSLTVNIFDYTTRALTDITGTRTTPTSSNAYAYSGLFKLLDENTGFNSNFGVHAHDTTGVQSLRVDYSFYTCAEVGNPVLIGLTSLNNGATKGQSSFTLTSTPSAQNNGQVTSDLSIPMTITATDLTSMVCPNGSKSSGNGTIELSVTTRNFSADPKTQTTLGIWDIRVGNPSPIPQPPGS